MPDENDSWRSQCDRMVREQIEGRGIRDPFVLAAMRKVARHAFVPGAFARTRTRIAHCRLVPNRPFPSRMLLP